jgi:exopolysaccharide biosynthesis polyprenyl glycosylphosphotransferase
VSGQAGDIFVRQGAVAQPAVAHVQPLRSEAVPLVRPARPTVLQFAPRHPGVGTAPLTALRRARGAGIVWTTGAALVAGLSGLVAGSRIIAVVAVVWLAAELMLIGKSRHVDELCQPTRVAKRHLLYAMSACVVGVALDVRGAVLAVVALLAALGAVSSGWSWLLSRAGVRQLLGVGARASVLVVADRSTAEEAVSDRAGLRSSSVVGVCLVDDADRVASVSGVPVLGNVDDVVNLVVDLNIHEVEVRLETPLDSEWLRQLQWSLEECGARLTLVTKLRNTTAGRVQVSRVGSSLVLGISQARPTGLVRRTKSVVDAVIAAAALLVALPLLAVCAAAVKLDSPGPAFFRQERVRDGDRTFRMLKLRTMGVNAEAHRAQLDSLNEVGGGLFKMRADPRVTRVGRVLRKLSLDELPQLVNVVRGEMALVGPRPALPSEVATYDRRASRRLEVKPGLTGLWQVSGRSRLSWDESVSLDIDYVDNWSPRRDLRIAIATVRAVVVKEGAY